MTQASRIHSPSIIAMLNSMGSSIHMPGEGVGSEHSHIGSLLRLSIMHRNKKRVISPTWSMQFTFTCGVLRLVSSRGVLLDSSHSRRLFVKKKASSQVSIYKKT